MASMLPVLCGREIARVFGKFGGKVMGYREHIKMRKDAEVNLLSSRSKEISRGTLRSLIRDANLAVAEFVAAV